MSPYLAELLGTALLIILGDGVVANVCLHQTKGQNAGWLVIATGWGLAVAISVYAVGSISGGHLNPAVTIAMASLGRFDWGMVPGYIGAQMAGAIIGAAVVWLAYFPHWAKTDSQPAKLGVFCTSPAIRHTPGNLITEIIATFMLVIGVLTVPTLQNLNAAGGWDKGAGPMLVGIIVWAVGLSLGGPTGYAINPARDLGPRIAHAILPIPGKGPSDWCYAWIPVAGPVLGGLAAALLYKLCWAPA